MCNMHDNLPPTILAPHQHSTTDDSASYYTIPKMQIQHIHIHKTYTTHDIQHKFGEHTPGSSDPTTHIHLRTEHSSLVLTTKHPNTHTHSLNTHYTHVHVCKRHQIRFEHLGKSVDCMICINQAHSKLNTSPQTNMRPILTANLAHSFAFPPSLTRFRSLRLTLARTLRISLFRCAQRDGLYCLHASNTYTHVLRLNSDGFGITCREHWQTVITTKASSCSCARARTRRCTYTHTHC